MYVGLNINVRELQPNSFRLRQTYIMHYKGLYEKNHTAVNFFPNEQM